MSVELPIGQRFYLWGEHYEVTGHTTVDGDTAAVWVNRVSKGREAEIRVPIKVPAIEKYATMAEGR